MSGDREITKMCQLHGIIVPALDLTAQAQELFEQFFDRYGMPNAAEADLLCKAGDVDEETINAWCKLKYAACESSY